ncbi:MAG: hypothetical protein ABIP16_03760, partial [Thermomonas sp.]
PSPSTAATATLVDADPVAEARSPAPEAESQTPIADAAENVEPEPLVELVSESIPDHVAEVLLVESAPVEVETIQTMDAGSRAEQLRGLFDTARTNSDAVDAPRAANSEIQADETEEATRNA